MKGMQRWCRSGTLLLGIGASAAAGAQPSLAIYGILDVAGYDKQLAGETKLALLATGGLSASRWGFRGTEDLGDGTRAVFDLSSFLQPDTGAIGRSPADTAPFFSRYSFVGLESASLGLVRLGRLVTPGFASAVNFNSFGDSPNFNPYLLQTFLPSASQPMLTANGTLDSAWANSVGYTSPTLLGLTLNAVAAAPEGTTAGRRYSVGGVYRNGPFGAVLSADRVTNAGLAVGAPAPPLATAARPRYTAARVSTYQAGLSYEMKVARLYAQFNQTTFESDTANDIRLRTAGLSVDVAAGLGRVLAAWAHTKEERGGVSDLARDTVSIGYDYFLSKRTDVYATGLHDRVTGIRDGNGFAAGMRHRF